MPEVIFETGPDRYTVDWSKSGSGYYYAHVNYDDEAKYIFTAQQAAEWRDLRLEIHLAGFDYTDKSINFIKVQFRCFADFNARPSKAKAIIKCGSDGAYPWFTDYGGIQSLGTEHTDFEQQWTLNPCVSNAWEWIDISKMHIGISGYPYYYPPFEDWLPAYCSRLKLLVDYNDWLTPPPEMGGFFL
jgi:hypothetical protein